MSLRSIRRNASCWPRGSRRLSVIERRPRASNAQKSARPVRLVPELAQRVAGPRLLNLDDVGAVFGQQAAHKRAGDERSQVQDTESREGARGSAGGLGLREDIGESILSVASPPIVGSTNLVASRSPGTIQESTTAPRGVRRDRMATDNESAAQAAALPNEHEIMQALKAVYDPELGISIVDLGLVYGVNTVDEESKVIVDMTLTTPACPLGPLIKTQAHAVLTTTFPAIKDVDMNLVWTPRWDPRTMASEEAKVELGIW